MAVMARAAKTGRLPSAFSCSVFDILSTCCEPDFVESLPTIGVFNRRKRKRIDA